LKYQKRAKELDEKDVVSEDEKEELLALQMDYEATRRVKEGIVLDQVVTRLTQAKQRSGLGGLS
jgi:FKBP-type peptidyl-prolyl cis-trans isomerase (trigger factor)